MRYIPERSSVLNSTTLYIFSGLPGCGKTSIAKLLAGRMKAAYLRVDTIEQALRELCSIEIQGEGYRLAYRVASDILHSGVSVVADSCNPILLTRLEWERVALDAGARHVNIEITCSDIQEHRTRVETRSPTVLGLRLPTWQEVQSREYHDWTSPRITIDTSGRSMLECVEELASKIPGGLR